VNATNDIKKDKEKRYHSTVVLSLLAYKKQDVDTSIAPLMIGSIIDNHSSQIPIDMA